MVSRQGLEPWDHRLKRAMLYRLSYQLTRLFLRWNKVYNLSC